ncbi:uncharacterized protein DUF2147 [Palleronia aestuarii]|uniref:Uncharacterized protein DUF2147 n=1 Tax=Palleronia aestuarii TaxID=568105 RepID=A0A2W7P2K5_9RHOB|nr:DUF2147 domain-containing protein [Palleronia aestuarii]PZX17672.1 uncharacterized protein DUF2147 [Palleronia aestuarii]
MRHILLAICLMMVSAGIAVADPVEGVWQTEVDDGAYAHIRMAPCGALICGVIARTFDSRGEFASDERGKVLVRDMKPVGGGAYEGRVWRPSNGKIYLGKMNLQGDRLKLRGCVAGGLICSSQTWVRVQ